MVPVLILAMVLAAPQTPEKQLIATISGPDLREGIISEITWDGGALVMQGVFAQPGGELKAHYLVLPADGTSLRSEATQSDASLAYWNRKASRVSPTGLGRIEVTSDTKLPQVGVGSLERRMNDSVDMGGTQTRTTVRIGRFVLAEHTGAEPYDGETWSWSPAELNRIAYIDAKGDLWIADADGRQARRLLRGDFTLPAWSDDGRAIAIAERKDGGRRWDISVVHLPDDLRRR